MAFTFRKIEPGETVFGPGHLHAVNVGQDRITVLGCVLTSNGMLNAPLGHNQAVRIPRGVFALFFPEEGHYLEYNAVKYGFDLRASKASQVSEALPKPKIVSLDKRLRMMEAE